MPGDQQETFGVKLPPDLAQLLARREARVTGVRRLAERSYLVADSPSGRLFAHISGDPADEARIRHEVSVRRLIGADGALRTPAVVASGDTWLLEPYIATRPIRGTACMDLVIAAAARVADLSLEASLPAPSRLETLARRWRLLRAPLPWADIAAARRVRNETSLPSASSHGDFCPENLLFDEQTVWVIDWELSGLRPVGYDLMQLWGLLEDPDDRDRVFEGAVAIVGETHRGDLAALRYAVTVATIAGLFGAPRRFDRDPMRGRELLRCLPELRAEAGLAT